MKNQIITISCVILLLGVSQGVNSSYGGVLSSYHEETDPNRQAAEEDLNDKIYETEDDQLWERKSLAEEELEDAPELFADTLNVTFIGKTMTSFKGSTLYAFQGLRYAHPRQRFQPPKELQPPYYDSETYVANHLPVKCSQHAIFAPSIPTGSEDCLFLSVYIPILPDPETNEFPELLPVMFFLHGGAFIWGDSSLYLPTRLLDDRVILVVPHYRLGSFGFFTTMDERAPGNTALYDQQMAMKWVQKHILSFGGDASKVTIFGQSAGSASVNYHLIMPESAGLFKGVIGESGSALEHWSLDPDPLESAMAIGEINGCNTTDIDTVYECMMELDAGVITLGINTLSKMDRYNGLLGFRGVAPIIQNPDMNLTEFDTVPLVVERPQNYFMKGLFNKDVSLMIGTNKQEGSFLLGIMFVSYMLPRNLVDNSTYIHEGMINDLIKSFGTDDKTHALAESLAELYLAGANRSDFDSCSPGMIDMSGMLFQKGGTLETAKLHSYYKDAGVNTYLYSFEFESDDTSFDWLFMGHVQDITFEPGVTHSDELLYLFSWPAIMEGHQVMVKDRLVKLWTNFAKYSDPTPDSDNSWKDLGMPQWKNFDYLQESYMLMEHDFTAQKSYTKRWTITNDEILGPEENNYKDQRDTFMAVMITFIVLFVAVSCVAGYFYYRWKY